MSSIMRKIGTLYIDTKSTLHRQEKCRKNNNILSQLSQNTTTLLRLFSDHRKAGQH